MIRKVFIGILLLSLFSGVAIAQTITIHDIFEDDGDGTSEGNTFFVGDQENNNAAKLEANFTSSSTGTAQELIVNIPQVEGNDYGFTVDVFIVEGEGVDGTYGEGKHVATWDPSFSTGEQSISIDPTVINQNTEYTIEFVTNSVDGDDQRDILRLQADRSPIEPHTYTNTAGYLNRYSDIIIQGTAGTPTPTPTPTPTDTPTETVTSTFTQTEENQTGVTVDNLLRPKNLNFPFVIISVGSIILLLFLSIRFRSFVSLVATIILPIILILHILIQLNAIWFWIGLLITVIVCIVTIPIGIVEAESR